MHRAAPSPGILLIPMTRYRDQMVSRGTAGRCRPLFLTAALAFVFAAAWPVTTCGAQADPQFNAEFDRADRRAQTLAWTIECYSQFGVLVQRGAIASIPSTASVGGTTVCFREGNRRAAANFTLRPDATGFAQFVAVHLASGEALTTPLDTTRLRDEGFALRSAIRRNVAMPDSISREYLPISMRTTADSIEIWMLRSRMFQGLEFSVGGELGYVFSPDGRALVREIGSTGTYRTLDIEPGRPVMITSVETRMPTTSELLLANLLAARGAPVSVQTATLRSTLMTGATMWVHVKR